MPIKSCVSALTFIIKYQLSYICIEQVIKHTINRRFINLDLWHQLSSKHIIEKKNGDKNRNNKQFIKISTKICWNNPSDKNYEGVSSWCNG